MAMDIGIIEMYIFTGFSPVHSGVCVSGHFNDLAAVAFLPPPRSPAKKHAGAAVSPTAKSLNLRSHSANIVARENKPHEQHY